MSNRDFCRLVCSVCSGLYVCSISSIATANDNEIDGDKLLDPQRLTEIRIEVAPQDWSQLCTQGPNASVFFGGGGSAGSTYTYFKADLWIDDRKIESVGIRKKGFFGSNDSQRPSLKVKFDEFVDQNPIKGLSRLTLNNNKQDRGLVSQLLTYQLFRNAGIAAPRCGFARVTVNGEYLGIYSNVESIKKPFLRRNFGGDEGNLYEGQITDFHPRALTNIEVKTNEDDNDLADIRNLAELLAEPGELDLDELSEIIDLDRFIRFWAIESLIGFWDGYAANQNNFYLYFDPEDGKGYFIPWGADWVFTRGGPFGGRGRQVNSVYAQSILANRLYHTEGIPQRYHEAMKEIVSEVWEEDKLLAQINQVEELLSPHLGDAQQGAPQAMEEVREFIRTRPSEVLDDLANGPVEIQGSPRKPSYTIDVGNVSGTFQTSWGPAEETSESSIAELSMMLDGEAIEFDQLTATAQEFVFSRFGRGGFGGRGGRGGQSETAEAPLPPINIVLTGTRENADPLLITLTINREQFVAGDDSIEVNGRMTEGQPTRGGFGGGGFGGRSSRVVAGELILKQAGDESGDLIAGELKLEIRETRGGMFSGGGFGGGRGGGGQSGGRQDSGQDTSGREGVPVTLLQRILDANGDGKLSADEIEQSAERLRRLDRNRDGEISPQELSGSSGR